MRLTDFGVEIKGVPVKSVHSVQLTLIDFGLTFEPSKNQTTLNDYIEEGVKE